MKKEIGVEWLNGAYEILTKWIADDLRGGKDLEAIHQFYMEYKIGEEKIPLTKEQFFLAYKSAELVKHDRDEWQKNKPKPKFQRMIK